MTVKKGSGGEAYGVVDDVEDSVSVNPLKVNGCFSAEDGIFVREGDSKQQGLSPNRWQVSQFISF